MMVPGSNLLKLAFRAIRRQELSYHAFAGRATNSIGLDVATYAPAKRAMGSAQPVPRLLYQQMGLDFQKTYFNVYLPQSVIDVARDVSGDQMTLGSRRLQCISKTPWSALDGWDAVLTVEVPAPIDPDAAANRVTADGRRRITADGRGRIVADKASLRVTTTGVRRITADGRGREIPRG